MKKYLFAASCILLLATACKKEPDYKDPLAGEKETDEIAVKVVEVTEGSACISWSVSNWQNPDVDFGGEYEFAVYSDATCETAVLGWKDKTLSRQLSTSYPDLKLDKIAFTFTGLQGGTDYWFQVKNKATLSESKKVKFTTKTSKIVEIGATEAAAGDVILYEDFSECLYGGDHVNIAQGYKVDVAEGETPNFIKAQGMNPQGVSIVNPTTDAPIFAFGQRIMGWAQDQTDKVHSQAGYVKIGKSNGMGKLITPVLSNLKQDKVAKVEVSFRACPYSAKCETTSPFKELYVEVSVCDGGTLADNILSTAKYTNKQTVEMEDNTKWQDFKVTIENVKPTSRIAIGGAKGEKSVRDALGRIFVDDIQIKVIEYTDAPVAGAELSAEKVFWSNAVVEWTTPANVTFTGYKLYLDNVEKATIDADKTSYNITDLKKNTQYTAKLVGSTADGDVNFNEVTFTTGNISQITKNVGPTTLSVAFDNCSGEIVASGKNGTQGCFQVELYEGENTNSLVKVYSDYVLDAQNTSTGHPFLTSLAAGSAKPIAPTAVAFGNLKPSTTYWFRVKSVASHAYTAHCNASSSYIAGSGTTNISSENGDSEFSELVSFTTTAGHSTVTDEVFYMGFDKITLMADFVNLAAGTYPAYEGFSAEGISGVSGLTPSKIAGWTNGWSFYPLRTQLPSSQIANIGWLTQLTTSSNPASDIFTVELPQGKTNASDALITTPAFAAGAKIYSVKTTNDIATDANLTDWYISNNVWPNQGCLALGAAYNSSDVALSESSKVRGFIVTPALETGLDENTPTACTVKFKALALQGVEMKITVGVWDASESTSGAPSWTTQEVALNNSNGEDGHTWYEHEVEVNLCKNDRIGFATDKNGTAVIDDIQIVKK